MILDVKHYKSYTKQFYKCSTYTNKGKTACNPHFTDFNIVYMAVLEDIKKHAVLANEDEKRLVEQLLKADNAFKNRNLQKYERDINKIKNRINEIEGLLQAAFEEKVSGKITEVIFKCLSEKYEKEHAKQTDILKQAESEYKECKSANQEMECWIQKIKQCYSTDTLTRALLTELIDHIDVSKVYEKKTVRKG